MAAIIYLPKHRLFQALGISYVAGQNYIFKGVLIYDAMIQDGVSMNPIFRADRLGELRSAVRNYRASKGSRKKELVSQRQD